MMSHFKKLFFVLVIGMMCAVSVAYAQTISFDSSNSTHTNSTQTLNFGFSNATQINSTYVNYNTTQSHLNCVHQISKQMNSMISSLNITKAKDLVNNNYDFKSKVMYSNYRFNNILTEASFDGDKCNDLVLNYVNLVYSVYDRTGNTTYNLIITEDSSLKTIMNMTKTQLVYNGELSSSNWSGYELGASRFTYPTLPTIPVYEASAEFHVPAISTPSNPSNACSGTTSSHCHFSIWSGLVKNFGASDNIMAQGGVEGVITCNGCSPSYQLWTEFLPAFESPCLNIPVSSGNDIISDVYNNSIFGGDSNTYSVIVVNMQHASQLCQQVQSYSQLNTPLLGEFIVERSGESLLGNSNIMTLPKFDLNPVLTGTMTYNNSQTSIYPPFSYGEYINYTMKNPTISPPQTVVNMASGSVDSGGTFTDSWHSSTNTCAPPLSGNWIISSNCAIGVLVVNASQNVEVQNNSLLTIPSGSNLLINFTKNHLLIDSGSGVLIEPGGKLTK